MLLEVNNLSVDYIGKGIETHAVKGVSFNMDKGEILGIVGESGSGKSTLGLALMMQLPQTARYTGEFFINGKNITPMNFDELRKIKGKEISVVFQEPMSSLNPLMKVGKQVEEILTLHDDERKLTKEEKKNKVLRMFRNVELDNPEEIYGKYPHELSGGMQQRVMIAMALMNHPDLLIADEPTTALDADVQTQILELLENINKNFGTAVILISHDLRVIRKICRKTLVMHNGKIVEQGDVEQIFEAPQDDYTKTLMGAFHDDTRKEYIPEDSLALEVKNLDVFYKVKPKKIGEKPYTKMICKNMNFTIRKGEILGLVGKSGSGKSSISRAILGLHKEYTGEIVHYTERPQMIFQDSAGSLNPSRKIGWILEEPLKNLNRLARKAGKAESSAMSQDTQYGKEKNIGAKTEGWRVLSSDERKALVKEMMAKVELPESFLDRYPRQLSGGQKQRVNIALALMSNSKFIIADEPVSALDVTIQEQIIELLLNLQKELNFSMLFISHDRSVVDRVCDRVINISDWKEK